MFHRLKDNAILVRFDSDLLGEQKHLKKDMSKKGGR